MGMVGDIAEDIKAVGQIAAKPLFATTLANGVLLYTPAHAIAATGLADFLMEYRMRIRFALLASYAYLLTHGLAWVFNVIGSLLDDVRMREIRRKWLTAFTPDERAVSIPYIRDQTASVIYSLNGDTV